MLINIFIKLSFLMASLLLFSCASQESITPFNASDVNLESNPGATCMQAKPEFKRSGRFGHEYINKLGDV